MFCKTIAESDLLLEDLETLATYTEFSEFLVMKDFSLLLFSFGVVLELSE